MEDGTTPAHTEAHVARCEERLRIAMVDSDVETLDELLADDLVFTSHLGTLWTKADDLAAHRDGAIKVRSVAASDERVRLVAGVAIVTVRLEISGIFEGAEASGTFRFTKVWAPTSGGRWQVVAAHSTLVPGGG